MNLLLLSGVEVPDPEKVVMDALAELDLPTPNISDLLSYSGRHHIPDLDPHPTATRSHPGDDPEASEDDEDDHFAFFNPDY